MNRTLLVMASYWVVMFSLAFADDRNEAQEPLVMGQRVIDLLKGEASEVWSIPPEAHWEINQELVTGHTGGEKLTTPVWLYTKEEFSDFEFTCELKLTGDQRRNTGIYHRVETFSFESKGAKKSFTAPSGYEFDAANPKPARGNYWGSVGDWYARPQLRVLAPQSIINEAYKAEEWNRMTMRARGNRVEYWVNGVKVMDFTDDDPKASKKGLIGFQLHDGAVMKIECRNIRVLPLKP